MNTATPYYPHNVTYGRVITPSTGTRYFEYRLAYEAAQEAYARYLPTRGTVEGSDLLNEWLDRVDDEAEAYQAYAKVLNINV